MKKALVTVGSGIGVAAGALVIWNAVIPAINSVFSMFGTVGNSVFSMFNTLLTNLF